MMATLDEGDLQTAKHIACSPSRLYHLEPIGVGTSLVESLTSYVTRLAKVHGVYPRILLLQEIIPLLSQPLWQVNRQLADVRLAHHCNFSAKLNGTSNSASDLVQALEQLTLCHNLRFLTLLTWQSILPTMKLLRRERAWCPACYESWRKSNHSIYDPLLWAIAANQVCPYHQLQLQTRCPAPNCGGRSMPPLSQRTQPGHCAYCQAWLGGFGQYQAQDLAAPEGEAWQWQQWTVNRLGEWLATTPDLPVPSREQIISTIASLVNRFTGGNKEAFSRYIRVPIHRVPQWVNHARIPELENLLKLCFHTDISLVDFFTGKVPEPAISDPEVKEAQPCFHQPRRGKPFDARKVKEALEAELQDARGKPTSLKKLAMSLGYDRTTVESHFPDLSLALKKRFREAVQQCVTQREKSKLERATKRKEKKLAHDTIRAKLETALQTTEDAPLPLEKVAQQVGYTANYLRKYFPAHCQAVVYRYKEFIAERGRTHQQARYNEIQEIVLELYKQGQDPSPSKIGKLLKHPGVLRDPEVRALISETKRAIVSTQ